MQIKVFFLPTSNYAFIVETWIPSLQGGLELEFSVVERRVGWVAVGEPQYRRTG